MNTINHRLLLAVRYNPLRYEVFCWNNQKRKQTVIEETRRDETRRGSSQNKSHLFIDFIDSFIYFTLARTLSPENHKPHLRLFRALVLQLNSSSLPQYPTCHPRGPFDIAAVPSSQGEAGVPSCRRASRISSNHRHHRRPMYEVQQQVVQRWYTSHFTWYVKHAWFSSTSIRPRWG